jgi:hypothetical protein
MEKRGQQSAKKMSAAEYYRDHIEREVEIARMIKNGEAEMIPGEEKDGEGRPTSFIVKTKRGGETLCFFDKQGYERIKAELEKW